MKKYLKQLSKEELPMLKGKVLYLEGPSLFAMLQKYCVFEEEETGVICRIEEAPFVGCVIKFVAGASLTDSKLTFDEIGDSFFNLIFLNQTDFQFIDIEDICSLYSANLSEVLHNRCFSIED